MFPYAEWAWRTYEKHNVELVLKPEEAEAVEYFAKLLRDRASEEAEAEDEGMEP